MKLILAALLLTFSTQAFSEWKTATEAGYVMQNGNTVQNNTYARTKWEKEAGKNKYTLEGEYINSNGEVIVNNAKETVRLAESAKAGTRYTRKISEKTGFFAGLLWEKNRFAGFDERYSAETGLLYKIYKKENSYLNSELGYRFRKQYEYLVGPDKGPDTESNFGRLYFEYGRNLSETSVFKFWVENLYDFSDSENYEMNYEASLDVAVGEFFSSEKPARVSLSFAYKGMYDNVPAADGLKRYDSIFTTALKVLY